MLGLADAAPRTLSPVVARGLVGLATVGLAAGGRLVLRTQTLVLIVSLSPSNLKHRTY